MSFLVVLQCVLVVISLARAKDIPLQVRVASNEHHVVVRSTPSLDPAEELLEKFGNENQMNFTEMKALFKSIGLAISDVKESAEENPKDAQTCFTSQHFYGMYSRNDGNINKTDLMQLCPAVLYQMTKQQCHAEHHEKVEKQEHVGKEDPGRAWGFGFLFVTIISVGSLIGAFVVPLMDKPLYKMTLMCMVSVAVGVLGGSGIFHLIPSALGLPFEPNDQSYLWKCAMIFIGLYLFLILECAMKQYIKFKDAIGNKHSISQIAMIHDEKPSSNSRETFPLAVNNGHGHSHNGGISKTKDNSETENDSDKPAIATVAWMIIIGDGLHNFIDGLAIGVSFSSSVVTGISTSLAVICEELPHELGDFAILLNSGLTYKQAMLANFLSACLCYFGLVIGLVLGYKTSAVTYIYGIAGGMFLYISLVDMLPEAQEMAQTVSGNSKSKSIKMLALVNFAITFGFGVMLLLAFYGSNIKAIVH